MTKLYRFIAILALLCLTACGAVLRIEGITVILPERATSVPTVAASPTLTRTATATITPTRTPSATATASSTITTTQSAPTATTLVNLNLRNGACATCTVLTVIPLNTTIPLHGRSADSAWLNVTYQGRNGWISSNTSLARINGVSLPNLPVLGQATATPGITPTQEDPTPTQERIGYNINGEAIPDMPYLLEVLTSPCKTHNLVMNNLSLAVKIKELCPASHVVSRNYSALEGDEWALRTASQIVGQWIKEGHREIIRHSTNEPSFGGSRTAQFITADIELMRLARANGFTLAMGNFSVGIIQPHDIQNGVWDSYIRALNQYGHYLGLHEYAVVALPFGVGQWQTSFLLDRTRVQPASWPSAFALPTRLWNGELPPYWYLRRGDWWLLRADAIGVARPRILLTEFGWDNLPNIKADIEPLRSRFGLPQYFMDMRGVNTYPNVWAWYWPFWTMAQAACEQLKWADRVYPPEYVGFALFTWSLSPDWRQTDFSGRENPAMYQLHDCLAA